MRAITNRVVIALAVTLCTIVISFVGLTMLLFGGPWMTLLATIVVASLMGVAIMSLAYLNKRLDAPAQADADGDDVVR